MLTPYGDLALLINPAAQTVEGQALTENFRTISDAIDEINAAAFAAVAANLVYAGPGTGAAAVPAFRALVAADIPTLTLAKISDAGTIAAQAANNVSITGGAISGITDLAVADGGTGASTAAGARTNLGLAAIASSGDAADLTGTISDLRLSSNVPLKDGANAFTNIQTVTKAVADATTYTTFTQAIPTSSLVNTYTGAVGWYFTVPIAITVNELGRKYHTGNTGDHLVKLWDVTTSTAIASGTVLAASASDGDGFKWIAVAPVLLDPKKQYAVLSDELNTGDTWNNVWDSTGYFNRFIQRYAYGAAASGALPATPAGVGTNIQAAAAVKFTVEIQPQLTLAYDADDYLSLFIRSGGAVAFVSSDNDKGIGFTSPVVFGKGEITAGYQATIAGSTNIISGWPALTIGDGTNTLLLGPRPSVAGTGISMRWATSFLVVNSNGTLYLNLDTGTAVSVGASGHSVGFVGATPVTRRTVTGSRAGNAALASLLTGLASLGLITDSSTA